jgi:hypothetical protein
MIQTYDGLEKIELVTKKGGLVKIGDFKEEDGYFNLTQLSKKVKINMHNFNRSVLVSRAKKESLNIDGDALINPSYGNGGKTLIHPILMISVIKSLSIEESLRIDKLALENL